jgi:uncharacterized protein
VAAEVVLVAVAAFVAATIAGVSGFGGAVVLLPVLVAVFGARDAIVVLTIAQLVGDGSRVCFNRDDVDGRREASRRPVAKVAPREPRRA